MRGQRVFDASLFGALLPAESWVRVPNDHDGERLRSCPVGLAARTPLVFSARPTNRFPVRTKRSRRSQQGCCRYRVTPLLFLFGRANSV